MELLTLAAADVGQLAGSFGVWALILALNYAAGCALSLHDPSLKALSQRPIVAHHSDDCTEAATATLSDRSGANSIGRDAGAN